VVPRLPVVALATSTVARRARRTLAVETIEGAAYAAGALLLATEGAVHAEQFVSAFYSVAWIGPLFLANAAACVVAIAGMCFARTRRVAGLAGVVISTVALLSLVVSYGMGLFGWQEGGFRPEVAIAAFTEAGAVIALTTALALSNASRYGRS
jgi:hypothetical protein